MTVMVPGDIEGQFLYFYYPYLHCVCNQSTTSHHVPLQQIHLFLQMEVHQLQPMQLFLLFEYLNLSMVWYGVWYLLTGQSSEAFVFQE